MVKKCSGTRAATFAILTFETPSRRNDTVNMPFSTHTGGSTNVRRKQSTSEQ